MEADDAQREVERFAQALLDMKLAYPHQLRGCSDEEVELVLEKAQGFPLPEQYVAFLRRLGKQAGRLLIGTDVYYPVLLEVAEWANEFAEQEDPGLDVSGRYFFASHGGYQYFFFDEGSPGEVFSYMERSAGPEVASKSFLDFLWARAQEAEASPATGLGDEYPD